MQQALTHRSATSNHNERLEFLGDSVLAIFISDFIYHRFSDFDEGMLTKLRAYLVRKETLVKVAKAIDIAPLIIIGDSEIKSGKPMRGSLLADTLEAVIGTLYLLRGMETASEFIKEIFAEIFSNIPPPDALKDAKTKLQEHLQTDAHALPVYELIKKESDGSFNVACKVLDLNSESFGKAKSKRQAEQQAAAAMLKKLLQAND